MQQHPFLKFFLIFISIICTQPFAEAQIYIDEWEKGTKNLEEIVQETEVIFDSRDEASTPVISNLNAGKI